MPKKIVKEVSSGGVLFRRESGEIEICLISTKGGRRWQLPKGHVEEGETPELTAIREVEEETGCDGEVIESLGKIAYSFKVPHRGQLVEHRKDVSFFLMKYLAGHPSNKDREVSSSCWFSTDEAMKKLFFKNEREVLRKAIDKLEK